MNQIALVASYYLQWVSDWNAEIAKVACRHVELRICIGRNSRWRWQLKPTNRNQLWTSGCANMGTLMQSPKASVERRRVRNEVAAQKSGCINRTATGSGTPTRPGGRPAMPAGRVAGVARHIRPARPVALRTPTIPPRQNSPFLLEKAFTLLGFAVAFFLVVIFGLDLATAWPLDRASVLFDTTSVLCGTILAYLSYDVLCDQLRRGLW
jgi:hypothetical protein